MINSKQKGKRGELKAVKYLKSLGYEARRTAQYSGIEGLVGDVMLKNHYNTIGNNLTIEVKLTKWDSYGKKYIINKWIQQTEGEGSICILWKPDRKPWRLGYDGRNGVWCWSLDQDRHKNILGILTERNK